MLLSVIMSTYCENERHLRQAIESILTQSYGDYEFLICVDNPENARIISILEEYSIKDTRIKYYINDKNMGLVYSLNKLISLAKGTYIARMDADDYSEKNRFFEQINYIRKNNVDIVATEVCIIDEDDNLIMHLNRLPYTDKKIRKVLCYNNCMPHPTWMVKKGVYEYLNGYSSIKYCEDYDFLLRARKCGFKFGIVKKELLRYRMTKQSISRSNIFKQYIAMKYCQERIIKDKNYRWDDYYNKIYSESAEKKYIIASSNFNKGLDYLKSGKIFKSLYYINKSFWVSRYFRNKMFRYILQII